MRSNRLLAAVMSLLLMYPFVVTPTGVAADVSETILLPWVPNGDTTGGLGPWYGQIEIQNPSTAACAINIAVPRSSGGWEYTSQVSLAPHARSIRAPGDIGLPPPGGAVLVASSGCQAAVSVKQASGTFVDPPWSRGARAIAGYTGVPSEDMRGNPEWILPDVQTNNGWNSFIRLTNTEESATTSVTLQIFPYRGNGGESGWVFSETVLLGAGATQTIDLLTVLGQAGFVGFARVTSDGNVVALVQREKPSYGMAMINVASAYPTSLATIQVVGSYALHAPIIFNAYNGWNTGINLANPNKASANVRITYPGAGRADDVVSMAPFSSDYVYTPANAPNQPGFTGNAVIFSDVPVAASVDEVKYSTNDAISYVAVPAKDSQAALPLVFRQSLNGPRNDNSGINISNGGDSRTTVRISIFDESGADVGGPVDLTIPAQSSDFIYMASTVVPPGTMGSATIQSFDGAPIVAVSNDVAYDVALDGSAVFNAPSPAGLYQIGGAPSP